MFENRDEMIPNVCDVSSEAGEAVFDLCFLDPLPMNAENNVLRPEALMNASHIGVPIVPDMA